MIFRIHIPHQIKSNLIECFKFNFRYNPFGNAHEMHFYSFSGVEDLIDDSSRSDDSSLEKSATPIVANDDSDSQTSNIKR